MFRAWEIKKVEDLNSLPTRKIVPEIYFRHIEKIMLYLAKYIIQSIVFLFMKYWFIILTKTKKGLGKHWPKVYSFFRKGKEMTTPQKNSFFQRAVMESKIKIRKIKENVKKEHGEK